MTSSPLVDGILLILFITILVLLLFKPGTQLPGFLSRTSVQPEHSFPSQPATDVATAKGLETSSDDAEIQTTAATPAVQNPVIRAVGNQPSATHQADITARLRKDSRNLDEKPPSKCFRISGIPSSWRTDEIFRALQSIDPSLDFQNHQLSLYPACVGSKKVALIQLNSSKECQYLPISESTSSTVVLTIDSQFHDLTPLNIPTGDVIADVIAVTGLAGHAYGSWRSRETHKMWLKDFLPQEVQNIRILSYGYDSRLVGSKNDSRLLDYTRHFIQQLDNARSPAEKNRPIIFIGHSLGGILILQVLLESKRNPAYGHIIKASRFIMFFGTPHQGLRTYDLEEMVDAEAGGYETSRHNLLKQLREGSEFLETQKEGLSHIWEEYRPKIISFYETAQTATVAKSDSGRYERSGKESEMVERFSAQLYVPTELRVPVEKDHTNMVKFATAEDPTYRTVVRHLQGWVEGIAGSSGI